MEEPLSDKGIQELLEELGKEDPTQEALPQEVEEVLQTLQSGSDSSVRREAAAQLGRVETSSHRIVKALIDACESDVHPEVNAAAAKALRTAVHQEYVQQYPDLLEATEGILQELRVLQRSRGERRRRQKKRRRRPKTSTLDPAGPLTPTELILLNGEQFALIRKWGEETSWIKGTGETIWLIHIPEAAVDAAELAEVMLAAAFLANEQLGAVHLEVRQEKALFCLLRYNNLYIVPGEHAISWPAHSFESQLRPLLARYRVSEIVSKWLDGEYVSPWQEVGYKVGAGLKARGLLESEKTVGTFKALLKGIPRVKSGYVLPAQTAALATQQSLEPIEQLLETCKQTRPEVWHLLTLGIHRGIRRCRSSYSP